MESREERYSNNLSRQSKNKDLYNQVYGLEDNLDNLPLSKNEIYITKMQTEINTRDEYRKSRGDKTLSETTPQVKEESIPIQEVEKNVYDINKVLDKVKADNDEYNMEKLPALLAILGKYEIDSPAHKLYQKRIEEDMRLQSEYYMKQLDNIAIRQQQVIDGFIKSKNSIIEQTGMLTKELLASVQKQTLELSQGGETSLKEIQQKQQTLLSGQKPLALSEGKQVGVKNK